MRGFRPDCDKEALRVIRLFNAWKPAIKDGQPVRQAITYPVIFRANAPLRYVDGQLIEYFDNDSKPTSSSQNAGYEQITRLDSITGIPSGELVTYEVHANGKPRELARLPWKQTANLPTRKDEPATYTYGHEKADGTPYGYTYTIDKAGKLLRRGIYEGEIKYDSTGMVYYAKNYRGNLAIMEWYGNGQLHHIETIEKPVIAKTSVIPYRLMSAWDSTGRQVIVDGNGSFSHYTTVESRADSNNRVQFTETGTYLDGLKNGVWTGNYSDGSYAYEELFEVGKSLGGSATINKTRKLTYGLTEQHPEFKGGAGSIYAFLSQTIRYPIVAAKAGIQGKVFLSFTICTDGSLCDYMVTKGVHSSIDEEALRVVRAMNGQWKPGSQRGEPVRVKYHMPISFQME